MIHQAAPVLRGHYTHKLKIYQRSFHNFDGDLIMQKRWWARHNSTRVARNWIGHTHLTRCNKEFFLPSGGKPLHSVGLRGFGGVMFKSVGAAAFFAAWRGLFPTTLVPHYREVFQLLPTELLPRVTILEEASKDDYVIRFMGTARAELWGKDLTGQSALTMMSSALVQAARRNMERMLSHPCGMYHVSHYVTPSGREITVENVTTPVGNDPGLPRRLINFVEEFSTLGYSEPAGDVRANAEQAWLDIGSGIPKKPPAK